MLVCIQKALLDIFDWEPSEMSELLKEKRKHLTGGDDTGSSRGKVGGLFWNAAVSFEMVTVIEYSCSASNY